MTTRATSDFTVAAGQSLSTTDVDTLWMEGSSWTRLAIDGQVTATASANGFPVIAIRASAGEFGAARSVTVGATGTIAVNSTISGFVSAVSAGNNISFSNFGTVRVQTVGEAWGLGLGTGAFHNAGTISVTATRGVTGISLSNGALSFTNTGLIEVIGGSSQFSGATGVRMYQRDGAMTFVNSGTIRATEGAPAATSVGIQTGQFTRIQNSGLIEAEVAIDLVRTDRIGTDGLGDHIVTNSGVLRGEVNLDNETGERVLLRNSGRIEGAVLLNNGNDTYNGDGGLVTGVVRGRSGADSLVGGAGAETLQGDSGDDTIDGGAGGADQLSGGDGVDTLSLAARATGVLLDVGAQTASGLSFSGFERYVGSAGADTLRGASLADTLSGGAGTDRIEGGGGGDLIDGGPDGGVIRGDDGADTLIAGIDPDDIAGGAGDDSIVDFGGANYVRGDDGRDSIRGGAAFDDINGNMGDDTAAGGGGDDWVVGGKDNDLLFGDAGADLVYGNLGADTCDGGAGADIVRGGQGDDVVRGGDGADFVAGDLGEDTLSGGAGADVFHTHAAAGRDRVTDFNAAEGDRVQLLPGTTYTLIQQGFDLIIDMGDARLVLVGVQLPSLPAGWIFGD